MSCCLSLGLIALAMTGCQCPDVGERCGAGGACRQPYTCGSDGVCRSCARDGDVCRARADCECVSCGRPPVAQTQTCVQGLCALCRSLRSRCEHDDECCRHAGTLTCRVTAPDGERRCEAPCVTCQPNAPCDATQATCFGYRCVPGTTGAGTCARDDVCALPGERPVAAQNCCRGRIAPDGRCCSEAGQSAGDPPARDHCCAGAVLVGARCVPCGGPGDPPPGDDPSNCCASASYDARTRRCVATCAPERATCSDDLPCCDAVRHVCEVFPTDPTPVRLCCPRDGQRCGVGGFCCSGSFCNAAGNCERCGTRDDDCDGADNDCDGNADNLVPCCPSPPVVPAECARYAQRVPGRFRCVARGQPPVCTVVDPVPGTRERPTWCPPGAVVPCDPAVERWCGRCLRGSCMLTSGEPDPCAMGLRCDDELRICVPIATDTCTPERTDFCYAPTDVRGCVATPAVGSGVGVCR